MSVRRTLIASGAVAAIALGGRLAGNRPGLGYQASVPARGRPGGAP